MSQITGGTPTSGPGSGTVTSISQGTGITLTPNPIVATGTVALTIPVAVANGGTNATSMTDTDGVVYYDGTRLVTTAVGTATYVLTSNGAGMAPTFQAAGGGGGVSSITGNSGGALTGALTLTGGTSGAVFSGSGTTLTESFNYLALPTTTSTNGQILINSAPVFHTYGTNNLFIGPNSGNFTFTVASNKNSKCTGIGVNCLQLLAGTATNAGVSNSAGGYNSGDAITTGSYNTLWGTSTGVSIVTGTDNTFIGYTAGMNSGDSSYNTGLGANALSLAGGSGALGTFNTALGADTGQNYTGGEASNILINSRGIASESNTLHIGAATGTGQQELAASYIHGIYGSTVNAGTGTAVLIDSTGLLGTVLSSRKYKTNIEPLEDSKVLELEPVSFNYKKTGDKAIGLIAEDVFKIIPSLVILKDNEPETVKYHDLPILLLKEIQNLRKELDELKSYYAPNKASDFAKATTDKSKDRGI